MIKYGIGHVQGHLQHQVICIHLEAMHQFCQFSVQCSIILFKSGYCLIMKSGNRKKQANSSSTFGQPMSMLILPSDWQGFLLHSDNKADLTNFLFQQPVQYVPETILVLVARGFTEATQIDCNNSLNLNSLQGKNEEAYTHVILHCSHCSCVSQGH